jgi:heme iron utilization protein
MAHDHGDVLQHINEDHPDDLLVAVRTLGGQAEATSARAVSVDRHGVDVIVHGPGGECEEELLFGEPIPEDEFPNGIRVAFVRMVREARSRAEG